MKKSVKPLIIAVIDIGSNSVKLLVTKVCSHKDITPLHRSSTVTRIGSHLSEDGSLPLPIIEKCMTVIKGYINDAKEMGCDHILAFATQAVRTAKNSTLFKKIFENNFSIRLTILSKKEEIDLSHKGVISEPAFTGVNSVHIDIGGGSTEITISESGNINFAKSIDMGCISLLTICDCKKAVTDENILQLKEYILDKFKCAHLTGHLNNHTPVGTGGSILQCATVTLERKSLETDNVHLFTLTSEDTSSTFHALAKLCPGKRLTFHCLEPERTDSIITGILILKTFLDYFNKDRIIVSTHGIRYGAIIDYLEKQRAAGS